ncbi:MAG: TetR family transcriptional regulator [Steroidobacteraceae bacterium]|nr:TetR family transcriptional regulator [Steroidobacteraceae bacterium]MBP7012701.1 TetR family transcriptional regulator [Steroidobacteraceae bacterium]
MTSRTGHAGPSRNPKSRSPSRPRRARGPGRPPSSKDAGDTRQAIVEAAIACFAERGYALTTNRDIATHAGVTSNLLYHYFGSKAAVFRAAVVSVNQRLLDLYHESAVNAREAPSARLLVMGLERVIELTRQRPEIMRFAGMAESEIQRYPELAIGPHEGSEAFAMLFRSLLVRARQRGELGPGIDVDSGVRVLSACFRRLAAMHGESASHAQFARDLRTFEAMLQGELMRPARRTAARGDRNRCP